MGKAGNFRMQLDCENDNNDDTMILVDGLDDAIIGYTDSWNGAPWGRRKFIVGRPHRAVYDRNQSIALLIKNGGMSQEEIEQLDKEPFDIDSQHMDENDPIFVRVFERKNRSIGKGVDLRSQFEEIVADLLYKVPIADGFDEAIIGYTDSCMGMNDDIEWLNEYTGIIGRPIRLVYDRDRCIEIQKNKTGAKRDKAEEDFESVESDYLGGSTPVFVSVLKRRKDF